MFRHESLDGFVLVFDRETSLPAVGKGSFNKEHMQKQITEAFLSPKALALRWKMTPHTLGQWRWKGHGPHFLKLGGRILYHREEIEQFEIHTIQTTTGEADDPRFLCITLEFTSSEEKEENAMSP